jgi:hypothetical protein
VNVAAADDEVIVETIRHPRGWIVVPVTLTLADLLPWKLELVLNTGRPWSALSRTTYTTLAALGQATSVTGSRCVIRNAQIGTTLISDIPMRLSAGPGLLGLEGMLGLDFLERFAEVRYHFPTLRLTLKYS